MHAQDLKEEQAITLRRKYGHMSASKSYNSQHRNKIDFVKKDIQNWYFLDTISRKNSF
jgi:hypothetical protein